MNKADIIQRLLEAGHITVAEAMILMSQDPTPMQPYYPQPWNDKTNPYDPPYYVTCHTGYNNIID